MRHVVHKVVLHLAYLLLPHHQIDGHEERHKEDDSEEHGRCHVAGHSQDVACLVGEMHGHHTHLACWVAAEERLRIAHSLSFGVEVRAAKHLTTVGCIYDIMEWDVDAITLQSHTQAVVQHRRIEPVLEPQVACLVHHSIDDLVEYLAFIHIGFLHMFLQMPDGTRHAVLSGHRESVGELRGTLAYELHASESVHGVRRCYLGHAAQ